MLEIKKFPVIHDHRGFFAPIKHLPVSGSDHFINWHQANVSHNVHAHTFRGLHFQFGNMCQRKAVYVLTGSIVDFAVDVNIHKNTIGDAKSFLMKAGDYIEIPNTYAHGFLTLEPNTTVLYFVDMPYSPQSEKSIYWDSVDHVREVVMSYADNETPELTISDKDMEAESFADFVKNNPPMSWEDGLRAMNYSEDEIKEINKIPYPPKARK